MSAFYATNKEVKKLGDKLDLLNTKLDSDAEGDLKVTLSGTTMELYGVIIADRPPADTVLVGTTFTIVDESGYFRTWISDGTKWMEV